MESTSLNLDLTMLDQYRQNEDFFLESVNTATAPEASHDDGSSSSGLKAPFSLTALLSPTNIENDDNVYSLFGMQKWNDIPDELIQPSNIFVSPISPPMFNGQSFDINNMQKISPSELMNLQIEDMSSPFSQNSATEPTEVFPCSFPGCMKAFSKQYNLRSHLRIHYVPKSHACSKCDRSFRRSHDLRRHERSHDSIKPYTCLKCNKSFTRQDALKRHHARFTSPCFLSAM